MPETLGCSDIGTQGHRAAFLMTLDRDDGVGAEMPDQRSERGSRDEDQHDGTDELALQKRRVP